MRRFVPYLPFLLMFAIGLAIGSAKALPRSSNLVVLSPKQERANLEIVKTMLKDIRLSSQVGDRAYNSANGGHGSDGFSFRCEWEHSALLKLNLGSGDEEARLRKARMLIGEFHSKVAMWLDVLALDQSTITMLHESDPIQFGMALPRGMDRAWASGNGGKVVSIDDILAGMHFRAHRTNGLASFEIFACIDKETTHLAFRARYVVEVDRQLYEER